MNPSLIVAMSRNRAIGIDGRMPWHLPDDLKRFRELTWGKPILMGRRTFEAIGRALPGRDNFVLSSNPGYRAEGCRVFTSSETMLDAACLLHPEPMVIGGATLYEAFMGRAKRIYLTLVETEVQGDTFFPEIKEEEWRYASKDFHPADARHPFSFRFITLERVHLQELPPAEVKPVSF
ncbi:MAG TPA: dihydrofolate reductase [Methylococcaceae bacterium]|nr:dihydrofolate reductase [Methylococcaceae bacterium]